MENAHSLVSSCGIMFAIRGHVAANQIAECKRSMAIAFTMACVFGASGCYKVTNTPPDTESAGRLHSAQLPGALLRSEKELNGVLAAVGQKPASTLLRVGHVLGAYREYAMTVDETGGRAHDGDDGRPMKAVHAVRLMKRAFDEYGLNSVELDVHVAPAGLTNIRAGEVVIVHNQPDWKTVDAAPVARAFLLHNTLRGVLDAFLEKWRSRPELKLYIEVKAPKECEAFDGDPHAECQRIGSGVARVMAMMPQELRPSLAFISFWPQMLRAVHDAIAAGGANANVHDYMLIAGPTSRLTAAVVSLFGAAKGKVPAFDSAKKTWLEKTEWMTGVWVSPRVFASLGHDMANINRARQGAGMKCLRVGVSTYQAKGEKFEPQLRRAWSDAKDKLPTCGVGGSEAPATIESLIYDIDTQ